MKSNRVLKTVRNGFARMEDAYRARRRWQRLATYLKSDRRPWSEGYDEYRADYLEGVLRNDELLECFRLARPLPCKYGFRLDARVVEIPWVLARLGNRVHLLDAGSSLNHEIVLRAPPLARTQTTIFTLAPESRCYWHMGISYVFGDLRDMVFRDETFDVIACISTIEHVGMDNRQFAGDLEGAQRTNVADFQDAVRELKRVLKPGGALYVSFPYGRYEDHGWFQQFDSSKTDRLIECFEPEHVEEHVYQYHPTGWQLSDRVACANCQFFDVQASKYFDPKSTIEYPDDYPAAERAVACLGLTKQGREAANA